MRRMTNEVFQQATVSQPTLPDFRILHHFSGVLQRSCKDRPMWVWSGYSETLFTVLRYLFATTEQYSFSPLRILDFLNETMGKSQERKEPRAREAVR